MPEEAFVLWIDMLGYKNWLNENENLAQAEEILLKAIKLTYSTLEDGPSRLDEFDIRCTLISDTILFWSYKINVNTLLSFSVLYHVLNCQLTQIGLPLRGSLSKGSIRIRNNEPRTVLGTAVVKCASLEPILDAFVVAIDKSIIEFIESSIPSDTEWQLFLPMVDHKIIATKRGAMKLYVLKWWIPAMAYSFAQAFRLFEKKLRNEGSESQKELDLFCGKLINSECMLDTVQRDDQFFPIAYQAWSGALKSAKEFLMKKL